MIFNLASIPFDELKQELPRELAEMADVISGEAILKLVDSFGGLPLYIPSSPSPESLLTQAIGHEWASALCKHYHGCEVFVPKLDELRRQYRNKEIIAQNHVGKGNRELALQYKLSSRMIRSILSSK